MKYINKSFALAALAMATMSSCSYYSRFDEPAFDANAGKLEPTTTLSELKAKYIGNIDYYLFDNAGHVKYSEVFNGYRIPEEADEIVNAIVVSTDIDGNTYKKMVLQDLTDGSAIDLSIDAGSLSGVFPRGQRVSLVASGWDIGDYADFPVMGYEYHNTDPKRNRKEIGRVPFPFAKDKVSAWGLPDESLIKVDTMTIAEIKAGGRDVYGRVVYIEDLELGYYYDTRFAEVSPFEQDSIVLMKDVPASVTDLEKVGFAFEHDLGVPISRAMVDATGNVINLTTSSYAKFATKRMPSVKCNIKAIVGWYKDQPTKEGSYQLSLQVLGDLTEVQ